MYLPKKKLLLIILSTLFIFFVCKKASSTETINHAQLEVERISRILESPDRKEWQKPDEVVETLKLKNGDIVADIGAGTGYFARRFAEKVAPSGVSIGYDINPAMVEYMQHDANTRNLASNYKTHLIVSRNPILENNYYDLIFFCNTYQYLENRTQYFKSLASSLKKNGRIVIIDFVTLESADEESGEVPENLVDKKTVVAEFKKAGFKLKREHKILPSQFFLEFVRK
ncbi:MAG: Ubiquinone/menaquinone biosynthesis C-methyltransferase UbiE [Turneriella sp.]|nr:Ubiquinone/menaquinone biosynthesis C-methyltransferase UbiE [Turneriella sp.]